MAEKPTRWKETFWFIILLPILLLLLAVTAIFYPILKVYRQWLKVRFWRRHGRLGRYILFVYSESPNWKEYLERNILPDIEPHAVILNWSKRNEWPRTNPLEKKVFHCWAGEREFNPIAIILTTDRKVKVVRFWKAFREFKHGKSKLLNEAEKILLDELKNHGETVG